MYVDGRTPKEVIKGIRAQLVTYATPDGAGPIVSAHEGEPVTFGGEFPAAAGRFIRARGQHRRYLNMPEGVTYSLRIYTLAVGDRATAVDGSREAEDELIAAWSHWITNIAEDAGFRADLTNVELGELEIAAQDRFGRMFTDSDAGAINNLLRLECDFIVTL